MREHPRRRAAVLAAAAVLLTLFFLSINSRCSFLYAYNENHDLQNFVTWGRCLDRGDVMYRDVYEHRGPYVGWFFALAMYLTPASQTGVWLLECVLFAAFLLLSMQTVSLFVRSTRLTVAAGAATALLLTGSRYFFAGAETEELVLPFMAATILAACRHYRHADGRAVPLLSVAAAGLCFAVVFWAKYTLCGLWAGLAAAVCILDRRHPARLLRYCVMFFAGALLGTLPVLLYFGYHHAFADLWEVYFRTLIFDYGSSCGDLFDAFDHPLLTSHEAQLLSDLLQPAVLTVLMLTAVPRRCFPAPMKCAVLLMLGGELLLIRRGMIWGYVQLPLFCFLPLGLAGAIVLVTDCRRELRDARIRLRRLIRYLGREPFVLPGVILLITGLGWLLGIGTGTAFLQGACIGAAWYLVRCLDDGTRRKHGALTLRYLTRRSLVLLGLTVLMYITGNSFAFVVMRLVLLLTAAWDLLGSRRVLLSFFRPRLRRLLGAAARHPHGVTCALAAVTAVLTPVLSPYCYAVGQPIDTYSQYKMAQIIRDSGIEDPIIVNYCMLDSGMYYLTGTYPPCRYYCSYNYISPEIQAMYDELIGGQKADFIVTLRDPEDIDGYRLTYCDESSYVYRGERIVYAMYQRRETEK
ncbi:MAG: hypothetical protein IJ055_07925 [Oscillospiraceae bacterium]|nr:hypothetical protein [Oscillospiraceae bacterium]